jgi:Mlc titration factor MtfA (ptsG expression regulator)
MKAKKYDNVKYIDGRMFKAYAATNHIEYLAEISEAYFSSKRFRNDYFPIVRRQLKSFDIDGYKLVEQVFQLDKAWIANFDKTI